MPEQKTPTVIGPDEGLTELSFGRPMFKLGACQGATAVSIIDAAVPPGGGFRFPHWHEDFEEAFYVLEGSVEYLLGPEWVVGIPGTTVFIPAGCIHAFRNNSDEPARMLVIGSSPDMLELIRALGSGPRESWDEICTRYRTRLAYESPYFPAA